MTKTYWHEKIEMDLCRSINRRKEELKKLEIQLKRIKAGDTLPHIERDVRDRFTWFCSNCETSVVGKDFFVANIPFVDDSVCKKCKQNTDYDLVVISKNITEK